MVQSSIRYPRPELGESLTVAQLQRIGAGQLAKLPRHVIELGALFAAAGHELALVGGPVRDMFLGQVSHDLDFTTSAMPEQTEQLLRSWSKSVWDIGRDFGTIGAKRDGVVVEITTYRSDEYAADSRKPQVQYGTSLTGDLTRRDFTVNAMAVRLPQGEFVDPCAGLEDLAAGVLRTPIAPAQSFSDDPLRIMRACRFAAQLGFDVEERTMAAMSELAERLEIVSAERIQAELVRLMVSPFPRRGLELMVYTGVGDYVLPELSALRSTVDEHHRHKDVYDHTLTVLDQAIELETRADGPVPRPDFILRFAAVMHDVGKPATRRFEPGGQVSFHHHEVVGAKMTRKRMRALKFDKATTKAVCRLVELHLRFHGYGEQQWSDSAVRRYVADAGELLERLHRLTRADCTTRNRRKAARLSAAYDDLEARIEALQEAEELGKIRPDLNGEEIMEILGIAPGPMVGKAYKYLLNLRLNEGPQSKAVATQQLREWYVEQGCELPDS